MRVILSRPALLKRVASAVVLGPIAFFLIYKGGVYFSGLMLLSACVTFYEWFQLAARTPRPVLINGVGMFYIPLCFLSFYFLRLNYDVSMALLFLLLVWSSDIGAYFTGKIIGGPKMAVQISPNKTWAGFIGAVFFPALIAWGYLCLFKNHFFNFEIVYLSVFCGVIGGAVGQLGDLLVSILKRQANQKNSGHLIPGHGGLLDRIDSMMLVAPVFLWFIINFEDFFVAQ